MGRKAEKKEAGGGAEEEREAKDKAGRAVEQEQGEPKRTCLGDSGTMKRMLDDAAIKVLLDEEDMGYEEDTGLSNVKLIVGFAGVGASVVSQIYPATFPKNWWVLLACCTFYFVCSGILQLLLSFVELESILLTRGKRDASGKRGSGFNLSSHFPRFQEVYTLGITPLASGSLGLIWAPKFKPEYSETDACHPPIFSPPGFAQQQWLVCDFFDDEGLFHEDAFCDSVRVFFKTYQQALSKKTE